MPAARAVRETAPAARAPATPCTWVKMEGTWMGPTGTGLTVSLCTQSTRFISESEVSEPRFFACWPSMAATAEKAQHEPHAP